MSKFAPNRYRGKLIIVEGIDGSGKSTQLSLLSQWLRAKRLAVSTMWRIKPGHPMSGDGAALVPRATER